MSTVRPPLGDVALAAALVVLSAVEVTGASPSAARFGLAFALSAPLAWRRVAPVASTLVVLAVAAIDVLAGGEVGDFVFFTVVILVVLYSLGAHADLQGGVVVLACAIAIAWWSVSVGEETASDYAFAAVVVVAPWLVGRIVGRRQAAIDAARDRAERAVVEERARIARELHDVVAHAVGVMVVQAGAAEEVLGRDPPAAREALANIRRTGKDALVDLRRMLGLLRESDGAADMEPQPGLDDLHVLADHLRQTGLAVEFTIEGERRLVPAGVALTIYRVAQEALTNVLKHTTGAGAKITLVYGSDNLELTVINDGRAVPNGGAGSGGHGLIGMRERVSLYGGELEAAPLSGGGFGVQVRLPYG